ncbi:glycosyltransferase family 32 protein [Clostridium perfringens]|uniref:glycosyltransferase family 32 protein n=1 Tax=Clostridium perfringens TaxID=1502 RepID=UPI0032DB2B44
MEKNIPKIIHYCWFGEKEKSKLIKKCIESWKKELVEYEFFEWNETNYDVNKCIFTQQAYKQKKWAFLSDYARLDVLYKYGGIYLDTDMEVLKTFNDLLHNQIFIGVEDSKNLNAAIIGSSKNNSIIKEIISIYNQINNFDEFPTIPNVISNYFKKKGFNYENENKVLDNNISIYSSEYFYPLSNVNHTLKKTKNTYTIHYYDASWFNSKNRLKRKLKVKLASLLGEKRYLFIKRIYIKMK